MLKYSVWLLAILFCGACGADQRTTPAGTEAGMPLDGKGIYRQRCVICHGADGALGLNGAGNLTQSMLPLDERVTQITKGKNLMPAFEGVLTPEEILAVATFTETLKK
jgi:cytochrome c6